MVHGAELASLNNKFSQTSLLYLWNHKRKVIKYTLTQLNSHFFLKLIGSLENWYPCT